MQEVVVVLIMEDHQLTSDKEEVVVAEKVVMEMVLEKLLELMGRMDLVVVVAVAVDKQMVVQVVMV
jgi:hypothetical protein